MNRWGRTSALVAFLLMCLVATGCTGTPEGPSAEESAAAVAEDRAAACGAAVRTVVDVSRQYVAGYDAPAVVPSPSETTTAAEPPSVADADLARAVEQAQRTRVDLACDPQGFAEGLSEGLAGIKPESAVARAVLAQLTASLTGTLETEPVTREVTQDDDLTTVLAELPEGSTLQLAPGTYALDDALVLLRGVVLRGAGRDSTTITSTAADSAVLVLTDGRVEAHDLTITRSGDAIGSVLVGGPASSMALAGVTVSGAVAGPDGQGGAGVLLTGEPDGDARVTTLEVTDSALVGNAAAGIALGGGHRGSVVASEFRGNGQCGVCFLADSDGAVRDSTFTDNGAGVAVASTASPSITGNRIMGGDIGVQVSGTAAPLLSGNVIEAPARAAVLVTEKATGRIEDTECLDAPFGLVVGPEAAPFIGENTCAVASTE